MWRVFNDRISRLLDLKLAVMVDCGSVELLVFVFGSDDEPKEGRNFSLYRHCKADQGSNAPLGLLK